MAGYAKQQLVNRTHPDDQMDPAKDRPEIRRQVRVNIAENPVDWLAARGMVSAQQQQAAEKLRQD